LTFALGGIPPAGAAIDSATGLFTWTPDTSQAPSTNAITTIVTDSGSPNKSDLKSFVVTVLEFRANTPSVGTNGVTLSWTAIPGLNYRVQYKTNLNEPAWIDLPGEFLATNNVVTVTDPIVSWQGFYRLVLSP